MLNPATEGAADAAGTSVMSTTDTCAAPEPRARATSSGSMAVRVLAVVLAAVAFMAYPPGADAFVSALLAGVVVVVAAIDIERRIIPNRIVLPAIAVVLIVRVAFDAPRAYEFVLASAVAGLVFVIPSLINRSWMGMGDVKLMMLLGAGLGWGAAGALIIALLAVFPVALGVVIRGGLGARKTTLPFGPFLATGTLVVLLLPHVFRS